MHGARASVEDIRTRCRGQCPRIPVSRQGTGELSGMRTRARRCRRTQFAAAVIKSHPGGGILCPRVTAHAFARAGNTREILLVEDAEVQFSYAWYRFITESPVNRAIVGRMGYWRDRRHRAVRASASEQNHRSPLAVSMRVRS